MRIGVGVGLPAHRPSGDPVRVGTGLPFGAVSLYYSHRVVIATHIVMTGYGHWLPNDIRGSMSAEVHSKRVEQAGPLYRGRKAVQPTRDSLRAFHQTADGLLHFPLLWWNEAARQAIADAMGDFASREGLTCYACAVLSNHIHLLVRRHRLKAQQVSVAMKAAGRDRVIALQLAPAGHPVFSKDCCHIYKSTPEEVRNCIEYAVGNYKKHRVIPSLTSWVVPYDGWPLQR
jgi:hypothetical protein